jgi:molybdate transport system regulatory protein
LVDVEQKFSMLFTKDAKLAAKLFLVGPEEHTLYCGPGMIKLLTAIKQTGNVRDACKKMGMSYSKGWKLLRGLEQWLGFQVTIRSQGGKGGGLAYLSEQGESFLEEYLVLSQKCQEAVQGIFEQYRGGENT